MTIEDDSHMGAIVLHWVLRGNFVCALNWLGRGMRKQKIPVVGTRLWMGYGDAQDENKCTSHG